MIWPSLDSLSATKLSWPEMCWVLSHQFPGAQGEGSLQKNAQWANSHASLLVYVGNNCGVVCCYEHTLV